MRGDDDASSCMLLFKVRSESFMDRGVPLRWVSAFPREEELLFPPLTCAPHTVSIHRPLCVPGDPLLCHLLLTPPLFGGASRYVCADLKQSLRQPKKVTLSGDRVVTVVEVTARYS